MPDKPFFMYFASGAMHAPHHGPQAWAEKYLGVLDDTLVYVIICDNDFNGEVNWVQLDVGVDDHDHLISPRVPCLAVRAVRWPTRVWVCPRKISGAAALRWRPVGPPRGYWPNPARPKIPWRFGIVGW